MSRAGTLVSARKKMSGRQMKFWKRFFEMVPALLSWSMLLSVVVLAVADPVTAAIFVICFYLFWFFRLLYMTMLLVASYGFLDRERNTDWLARCFDLADLEKTRSRVFEAVQSFEARLKTLGFSHERTQLLHECRSQKVYAKSLDKLQKHNARSVDFRSIYHLVIFPNYREEMHVLESALEALRETHYPLDRMMVVMAFEEREGAPVREKAAKLKARFEGAFFSFLATFHPANLPGERAVKGANATWAAKKALEFITARKIPVEHVLVSCFDADTRVSHEYFGCLTFNFLSRPDGLNCSFQPVPVYHNNLWDAPGFARMMETSSSYWQLIESANPDHLVTFSSHSMSLKALVESGFWPVDMISDDSAIFWKCFLHYEAAYRVVPLYVTVSMNIVIGNSWVDTFRKIYVQKRRWAWGIENFPNVALGFLQDRAIPFKEKARHILKMLENHISWATWGLMVTIFGWLPVWLGGRAYGMSVVSYNLPRISQMIFHLAGISILVSIALSLLITPKVPPHVPKWKKLVTVFHWLLLPIILPLLLALPALDAQTRLLFGRPLHFEVSRKVRASSPSANAGSME